MAEGDVVILQGGGIKEFLYLDRGCNSRKEEEKGEKRTGVEEGGEKVSISL